MSKHKPKSLQSRILSGSMILLTGSGLAAAINFVYNIAVARFLGPSGYGAATAVYTILVLLSAVVLSFQIVSAKIVAQQETQNGKHAGYRGFHAAAWVCGIFAALLLLAFRHGIAESLRLHDPFLIVLLAIGIAIYVPLGSRRGYLQGAYGFRRLAVNLVLEGVIRLFGSLALILLGFGVPGVIAANSAAVAVAYFAIHPKRTAWVPLPIRFPVATREMWQAIVFFAGQVLINNSDIVLVKHFFLAEAAGIYAAVAMVGRVIFSLSQSVVNSMFPLVAGSREEDRRNLSVIATALLLVLSLGSAIALCLRFVPSAVWTVLLGARFELTGHYSLSYMLALYAVTSVIYSLSAVVITFEMSYKIANTSFVQLAFSGLVIGGICLFHSSLREVILVQFVLMLVLLVCVAVPFLISALSYSDKAQHVGEFLPVTPVRRVSEDEIIAEFLRSDLSKPEFQPYKDTLGGLLSNPDFTDEAERSKRKKLFLARHLALWTELPQDTEWYELELREENLAQIRLFPRAQWRKLARGNFSIVQVIEWMRAHPGRVDGLLMTKLDSIRSRVEARDSGLGSVILIGVSDDGPLTLLDGNHRLVAAMLDSNQAVCSLRFFCGLSPRMRECCWYNTNLATLLRYGRNIVLNAGRRPKNALGSSLESLG